MTVYAGLQTTPSQVVQITTPGMTEAGRWIGEAGDVEVPALDNLNEFNEVAPNVTPGKIISLQYLKVVQRHTLGVGEGEVLASVADNDYLYIAPNTDPNPGIIKKVDPLDLTEVARWTGAPGDGKVLCLMWDSGVDWSPYLFAGLDSTPAVVVKIRLSDMVELARWTGGGGDGPVKALTFLGYPWIAAGLNTGDVVRIWSLNMTEGTRYSGAVTVLSVASDRSLYVFAGLSNGDVLQINLVDMTVNFTWSDGGGPVNAMFFNGNVYAGLGTTPAVVVKLNYLTMVEMDRWTGGGGDSVVRSMLLPGAAPPIYVGLETKTVVALNIPIDMTEFGRWTGDPADTEILSLTQLYTAGGGNHVWAGLNASPGVMVPISWGSMREAKIWEDVDVAEILCLEPGYAGLNTDPGVVIKFVDDFGAMWEDSRWTGGVGDGPIRSLLRYGSWVFAGLETGQVVLLDDTMAEVARWEGADPVIALAGWGAYLYAGLGITPGEVVKIEVATMTEDSRWTGVGVETVTSLAFRRVAGVGYLYIGGAGPTPAPPAGGGGGGSMAAKLVGINWI